MESLREVVETALRRTQELHDSLGQRGEEVVQSNQFGESAFRMDIEAEATILQTLRDEDVPIRVVSEEHGTVDIGASPPRYLGILDGLDGSNRYHAGRGRERYGTMFGILSNLDPRFDDYLVSAIMELSTSRLFLAERGRGCWLIAGGAERRIHVAAPRQLVSSMRVYVDGSLEINRTVFSRRLTGFAISDPRAFSTYFSDLAMGDVDFVLASTRKHNLEPTIGYGLVTEAGGVILALDGSSLRDKKYLEFGHREHEPIVAASSEESARELIARLREGPQHL